MALRLLVKRRASLANAALFGLVSDGAVFALSYATVDRKRREIKRRHELAVREE